MSRAQNNKPPLIERVTELAMRLSGRHLAEYGATTSRHDFTQRQLMTCLILRTYLRTTYRGVVDLLASSASLRECLGLADKLPHYTTLQKFSARSQVVAIAQKLVGQIGQAAAAQARPKHVAMDGTGLAGASSSEYFRQRSGRPIRRWVKVSVMIFCSNLLPAALVVDSKPTNDCRHGHELITQAQSIIRPKRLYADAGYDAEPIHQRCRQEWGVESVIQPVQRRADGRRGGRWRARMTPEYLENAQFGRRWSVESFFSAVKRTMGSSLSARRPDQCLLKPL